MNIRDRQQMEKCQTWAYYIAKNECGRPQTFSRVVEKPTSTLKKNKKWSFSFLMAVPDNIVSNSKTCIEVFINYVT